MEKPFDPSPKRLREAREKGQTAFSQSLASAISLFGASLLLYFVGPKLFFALMGVMQQSFSSMPNFRPLFGPMSTLLAGFFLLALFSHYIQKGWIFSTKRAKRGGPTFSFYPVIYTLLVLKLLSFIAFFFRKQALPIDATPAKMFYIIARKGGIFLIVSSGALVLLGIFDYFFQRYRFRKKMRMSYEEKMREEKENERRD